MEKSTEIISTYEASCDGKSTRGQEHPLIYFHLDDNSEISCPYCSKVFIKK